MKPEETLCESLMKSESLMNTESLMKPGINSLNAKRLVSI